MNLPAPLPRYSEPQQAQRNMVIEEADRKNVKKNTDIEMGGGAKLILHSPNGTRWNITVSNAGALTATALAGLGR